MLDDARLLAWGCVSYLPLTPFVARVALALFGPSLAGLRFFAALGQSIVLVLVGLIARALGGSRRARVDQFLANRVLAGLITNAYGVPNEDSLDRPDIFVCRGPRQAWPDFWRDIQIFG